MPSPFPGMNPWLEQDDVWQDFHESLIPVLREMLVELVRPKYLVKIDEHLYVVERQSYLEIRDRKSRELITVIEVLSPTNKRTGSDREQFLAKRKRLLPSTVHYVEFDLLRGGPRMPVDDLPACDYYALVSLAEERPRVGIWPIGLRDPLPQVPIPLRAPDPPVHVDLQQAVHRVYDAAGYADYIYSGRPHPPLPAADAEWAEGMLPGRE